jgi:hypothetical protein
MHVCKVQCRPADPNGNGCSVLLLMVPCGGGVLGLSVMSGQSWFLWLVVCMWCM